MAIVFTGDVKFSDESEILAIFSIADLLYEDKIDEWRDKFGVPDIEPSIAVVAGRE